MKRTGAFRARARAKRTRSRLPTFQKLYATQMLEIARGMACLADSLRTLLR